MRKWSYCILLVCCVLTFCAIAKNVQQTIVAFIEQQYPGALIEDWDNEKYGIDVEIRHNKIEKEVRFTHDGEWIATCWEIRKSELPALVLQTIKTNYPNYRIDDIDYKQTPQGNFYKIELEDADDHELVVRINEKGELMSKKTKE